VLTGPWEPQDFKDSRGQQDLKDLKVFRGLPESQGLRALPGPWEPQEMMVRPGPQGMPATRELRVIKVKRV
jgi:hypothetical protein